MDNDLKKIRILLRNENRNDEKMILRGRIEMNLRRCIPLESNLFFLSIQVKYQSWQDQAKLQLQHRTAAGLLIAYQCYVHVRDDVIMMF